MLVAISLLFLQLRSSLQEFPQSGKSLPTRITALPLASDLLYLSESQLFRAPKGLGFFICWKILAEFLMSEKICVAGHCVTFKGLKRQQVNALLAQGCSFALKNIIMTIGDI